MKLGRGFTLLELMVTIAVLAILATVGVPSFRDLIQNNRVTTQTNELVSALSFARTEAVKRGRNVDVVLTQQGTGWRARVALNGAADALRVVDRGGSSVGIDEDVTIVFGPTGVPGTAVTVGMEPGPECSGDKRREIEVRMSGQVRTSKASCD